MQQPSEPRPTCSPAVERLCQQGSCTNSYEWWPERREWLDYLAMGLTPADVPALIALGTDDRLLHLGPDQPEGWQPMHAWRALAQLGATESIEPLMNLLRQADVEACWSIDELPRILALLGPLVRFSLANLLADEQVSNTGRVLAAAGLRLLAQAHFTQRSDCIDALAGQLSQCAPSLHLNTVLVRELLALGAVEAADAIEAALQAGCVRPEIVGTWEHVQAELGIGPACSEPPAGISWCGPHRPE